MKRVFSGKQQREDIYRIRRFGDWFCLFHHSDDGESPKRRIL